MGKHKRGGYIFLEWIGDHRPKHLHIFEDGEYVGKWNLEDNLPMEGTIGKRLKKYIAEIKENLKKEGKL